MNRKAFIAACLALLMPWKKAKPWTATPITVTLKLDDSKLQEMIRRAKAEVLSARMQAFRSERLREMEKEARETPGASFEEINDPTRPHYIGCIMREVEG